MLLLALLLVASFMVIDVGRQGHRATSELAGVTVGWPTDSPRIDDGLRSAYFTIYDVMTAHPASYVGMYHTGDRIMVEIPPGERAEVRTQLVAERVLIRGVEIVVSHKSTAETLMRIRDEVRRAIPTAHSAAIDWQGHQVVVSVLDTSDRVRRLAKDNYGDNVILEWAPVARAA